MADPLFLGRMRPTTLNRFQKAALSLRDMPPEDRIQMLVKAGLMEQPEADRAKARLRQPPGSGKVLPRGPGVDRCEAERQGSIADLLRDLAVTVQEMSPAEFRESLRRAGIIDGRGKLTKMYRREVRGPIV